MDSIKEKIIPLLQLAMKAKKIALGHDHVMRLVQKKKVFLLIVASDLSKNSYQSVIKYTDKQHIDIVSWENKDFYFQLFGKYTGIVGILDKNFSNGIKKLFSNVSTTSY
ncbi:MAG: ribosomal L7Ae/L30e/S12e/Gadd45 family protein [Candidatus Cloacimonetes bacterium]|nr:ribosomal L7Ae/L30e/S12e/Gadd45 family protein [Candidatus Cloacimonadota bacterium]